MSSFSLLGTGTSPFVRRVRIALQRAGIVCEERLFSTLYPPPAELIAANPLGLAPVLLRPGLVPICDSSDILDFLDDTSAKVWPRELQEKWKAKSVSRQATGVLDLAVGWLVESRRGDARADVQADQEMRIKRILESFRHLKLKHPHWWRKPHQTLFDVGIALEYLAFRLPHLNWEDILDGADDDLWDVLDEDPAFANTRPPGLETRV
jgi:glutathione S-transferase